ncbi:adenosine deaminase [Pandoraea terrae]|uniref:Adenosine deaminase n=1 Tax=Pandoraea terrae TaxID=1537710 RepID=A0A5E4RRU8_9BURK|nr:adenosine deaminase [Pandoraea terrae]
MPATETVLKDRIDPKTRRLIEALPKAELHIHLEGSLRAERLVALARRHRVTLPFDARTLAARRLYADLGEFLDIFAVVCDLLRTPEDFEDVVCDLGEDAARQNIVYREVMFTPTYYAARGPALEDIVAALAAGREWCMRTHGVRINFIADIDRGTDPGAAVDLVNRLAALQASDVVRAVGMDGAERDVSPCRLLDALHAAHSHGFHVTAHLGSDESAAAVLQALHTLPLDRIDHGVRCIEDAAVLAYIAAQGYPMTICPLSNVAVDPGRYASLVDHPFRQLLDAGARITVNSDDPGMFAGDLIENLAAAAAQFALTHDEILRIVRTAFEASFASSGERTRLLAHFDEASQGLREKLA